MSMTKIEIINSISDKIGIPKKDCARVVESVFDIIKGDLISGNDVKISGFGKWTVKAKKERNGRNPKTGEGIKIAARQVITFKSSQVLRKTV